MQGSSSSWSSHNEHEVQPVCPRCNVPGARRVSHPGRVYMKCMQCDKFLGWADVVRQNSSNEAKILGDIQAMRQELRELKMIMQMTEKGQSIIVMLLIFVIIVQSIVIII